jgi:hypothetical protein
MKKKAMKKGELPTKACPVCERPFDTNFIIAPSVVNDKRRHPQKGDVFKKRVIVTCLMEVGAAPVGIVRTHGLYVAKQTGVTRMRFHLWTRRGRGLLIDEF